MRIPEIARVVLLLGIFSEGMVRAANPGVGVGSGGDSADRFLHSTRAILSATLARTAVDEEFSCSCKNLLGHYGYDAFCRTLESLSPAQQTTCTDFIRDTRGQIQKLMNQPPRTPFRWSLEPILIDTPDGPRPVKAQTMKGPAGPIDFHYASVQRLAPMDLFALMAHEFGHKVFYGGLAHYIDDNEPVGPFPNGRHLLDVAGAALATYAVRLGYLGYDSKMRDLFSCNVSEAISGSHWGAEGETVRLFKDDSGKKYETGVGNLPRDFRCFLWEGKGETKKLSRLEFTLHIREQKGCKSKNAEDRETELELWRVYTPRAGVPTPNPERINHQVFAGVNPLCANEVAPRFALSYVIKNEANEATHRYQFDATFVGSGERND